MAPRHDRASGSVGRGSTGGATATTRGGGEARESPSATGVDPLSDVLRSVRLTGALFFLTDASSPWVQAIPRAEDFAPILLPGTAQLVSYHVVCAGACWCALPGRAPVRLEAGDVLVIPRGDAYTMASDPILEGGAPAEALDFFRRMARGELPFVVSEGGGGPRRLRLACGFLSCDDRPFNPLLGALPELVRVRAPRGEPDRLAPLLDFALAESRSPRSGGQCVLLRLSELMFVEVMRRHLTSLERADVGWLAGLRDPVAGPALGALHREPARAWTLDALAREIGASRSTLAERFADAVGVPPIQYLARWRIQRAASLLRDGSSKMAAVARDVGYESEASFSRAFKRMVGETPSAWRARSTHRDEAIRPAGSRASARTRA